MLRKLVFLLVLQDVQRDREFLTVTWLSLQGLAVHGPIEHLGFGVMPRPRSREHQ